MGLLLMSGKALQAALVLLTFSRALGLQRTWERPRRGN